MKKLILLGSLILSTLTFTEEKEIERVIYQEGKIYKVKCEIIAEIPFEEIKYNYLDKIDSEIDKIMNAEMDTVVKMLRIYQLMNMRETVEKLDYPSASIQSIIEDNLR